MNGEFEEISNSDPDPDELKTIRVVADRLAAAIDDFSTSPETHAVVLKSYESLFEQISDCIVRYGALVLEVEGTLLHYRGHDLSGDGECHETLAYSFYRDGIVSLSFHEGIQMAELAEFLRIAGRHRHMEEAGESDMVTDLWEAGFTGIRYAVSGEFRRNDPLIDIPALKTGCGPPPGPARAPNAGTEIVDAAMWRIGDQDLESTRRMVAAEVSRNVEGDVLELVLEILKAPRDKDDIGKFLEIAGECFRKLLSGGEFRRAGEFAEGFLRIRKRCGNGEKPSPELMDSFRETISGPVLHANLSEGVSKIGGEDTEKLRDLEKLLLALLPGTVLILGRMLPGIGCEAVRRVFISAIRQLSEGDPRPLIQLSLDLKPAVSRQAIEILGTIEPRANLPEIHEAAQSGNPAIRAVAVMALTRFIPPPFNIILPYILDHDEAVRNVVFQFLCRTPCMETENAVAQCIIEWEFPPDDTMPVLMLYRALGRAGSSDSLEFLKYQLCSDPWRINELRTIHRIGAADALMRRDEPESEKILKKAAGSLWPTIRKACRKAREMNDGNGNPTGRAAGEP